MPLYLCVDCGGSKTSAVIADHTGNPVGRALGGPSNVAYLGLAPFVTVVKETVEKALRQCDPLAFITELPDYGIGKAAPPLTLPAPPGHSFFAAVWLGVSGCDSPAAIATLTLALEPMFGVHPRVANDTHLLAAPMKIYPDVSGAVAVVAGTGGIVVSFREAEQSTRADGAAVQADTIGLEELGRVGGWGWILGDEGGGFHVGREAIRQVLDEADRAHVRPKTSEVEIKRTEGGKAWGLKNRLLERFGIEDVYELLTIMHLPDPVPSPPPTPSGTQSTTVKTETAQTADPNPVLLPREKRLSSLSPLVFAAAFEDEDPLALNVLQAASNALVDQICVLLKREGEDGARTIRASETILCLGGSLSAVDAYRALMVDELKRRGHVFRRVQVVDDAAAAGARALAVAAAARGP